MISLLNSSSLMVETFRKDTGNAQTGRNFTSGILNYYARQFTITDFFKSLRLDGW